MQVMKKNTIAIKFKEDKNHKIVQFTDTQDDEEIDPRTVQLRDRHDVIEEKNNLSRPI